jgi:hypothetical protein
MRIPSDPDPDPMRLSSQFNCHLNNYFVFGTGTKCTVVYTQPMKNFLLVLLVISIVCLFHYFLTAINIHFLFFFFILLGD